MHIPNRERSLGNKFASIGIGGAILGSAAIGAGASLLGGDGSGNKAINFTKRQISQTRRDMKPWVTAGQNALVDYQEGIGGQTPMYGQFGGGAALPEYTNQAGGVPGYQNNTPGLQYQNQLTVPGYQNQAGSVRQYQNQAGAPPEYGATAGYGQFGGGDRFNWDSEALQNDPGYNFVRNEAMRGTARQQNASGGSISGNKLTALQDRSGKLAASYSDQFRQRAGAENAMNYGRDVGEYGMGVDRNQDIYNRNVNDYGLNTARNQDIYSRGLQDYATNRGADSETYARGQQDYATNLGTSRENYGRGTQDFGINFGVNQDQYSRGNQDWQNAMTGQGTRYNQGVSDYGIGYDANQGQYGRDLDLYRMNEVARNQDLYGRDQNELNRLEALSGTGLNAASQGAGLGNTASNISSPGGNSVWNNLNNVAQGSISNYLTYDALKNNPYQYPGGQYAQYGGPTGGNSISGYTNPVGR